MDIYKKKLQQFDEEKTSEYENLSRQVDENPEKDDDFGYELDDSGHIPKLEELKAAGKKENKGDMEEIVPREELENGYMRIEKNPFEDEDDDIEDGFDDTEDGIEDDIEDIREDFMETEEDSDVDLEQFKDDFSDIEINYYDERDEKVEYYENIRRIADYLEKIADVLDKKL